jgi:hypothetical protein
MPNDNIQNDVLAFFYCHFVVVGIIIITKLYKALNFNLKSILNILVSINAGSPHAVFVNMFKVFVWELFSFINMMQIFYKNH